jgi:putative transposase
VIQGVLDQANVSGATAKAACSMLGLDARTVQRWAKRSDGDRRAGPKRAPANKLAAAESAEILRVLNTPEFRDLSPNVAVALLADRGTYLASQATMYRLLRKEGQLSHRTAAKPPIKRAKPREVRATAPNQAWSWDITYLSTVVRGSFYRLYMIMDIFSRKIVGWAVHESELGEHAARLVDAAHAAEGALPGCVLHADNGGPMKAATMIATLERLGVVPSFSRPHVSDDNPYSESLFRTLKYCPAYPTDGIFTSLEAARAWVAEFVAWFNTEHRHSGVKFVTPDERHQGLDARILEHRAAVYAAAKRKHPGRWSGEIRDWSRIDEVRLNPDAVQAEAVA